MAVGLARRIHSQRAAERVKGEKYLRSGISFEYHQPITSN